MKLISTCKDPGLFVFTFDDGVSNNFERLLDILAQEKIKATFFIVGNTLLSGKKYMLLHRAFMEGHTLGNHTWSHANILKISLEQLDKELLDTETMLDKVSGNTRKLKFFRPPYGAIDQVRYDHLVAKGYKVVYWNLDLNDWNVKISKATLLNSYKKAIEESDPKVKSFISLQHDMRINSVELVPDIAKMIRDQGFKIVSLAEGL